METYTLRQTKNNYINIPTLTGKIKLKESIQLSRVDNDGKSPLDSNFIKEGAYYYAMKGEEVEYIKFAFVTKIQHKIMLTHRGVVYTATKHEEHKPLNK